MPCTSNPHALSFHPIFPEYLVVRPPSRLAEFQHVAIHSLLFVAVPHLQPFLATSFAPPIDAVASSPAPAPCVSIVAPPPISLRH